MTLTLAPLTLATVGAGFERLALDLDAYLAGTSPGPAAIPQDRASARAFLSAVTVEPEQVTAYALADEGVVEAARVVASAFLSAVGKAVERAHVRSARVWEGVQLPQPKPPPEELRSQQTPLRVSLAAAGLAVYADAAHRMTLEDLLVYLQEAHAKSVLAKIEKQVADAMKQGSQSAGLGATVGVA